MAPSSRLCLICGSVLTSDAERIDHIAAAHPGQRVAWVNKSPHIVGIDGTQTRIPTSALRRMRANARTAAGAAPRRRKPKDKAAPEAPAIVTEQALPDSPDAPPYFVQRQPERFSLGGEPVGPAADDDGPRPVSREQLRLDLDRPMLAEMIRNLSIVISDWDGAGPAGHFSHIEAGQLAMLLHEPTIDVVDRWFGGNVNRFRLGMAAVIILLGKGRIHYRAIVAKRESAAAAETTDEYVDILRDQAAAATVREVPVRTFDDPADVAVDPVAELAARQRAWRTAPP